MIERIGVTPTTGRERDIAEHNETVAKLGGWDAIVGGDPSLPPKGRDFDERSVTIRLAPDDDGQIDVIDFCLARNFAVDSGKRVSAVMKIVQPTLHISVIEFTSDGLRLLARFLTEYADRMETIE